MSSRHAVMLLFCVLVTGGCSAGAQLVRKDPHGGTIAVWGAVVPATQEARHVMVEHCGGRFAVSEADDVGVADDSAAMPGADAARVPEDAQVVSYRCLRPATLRSRNTMAFLRGGFER